MERTKNIETIRTACIKTNPGGHVYVMPRPIRLADVLLALFVGKAYQAIDAVPCILDSGIFYLEREGRIERTGVHWHLAADDLTTQSDECLEWLVALLTH